jgi:hypothetical protein
MGRHKSHHADHSVQHKRSSRETITKGPIVGIGIASAIFVFIFLAALFKCRRKRQRFGSKVPEYSPVALEEAKTKRKERKIVDDINNYKRVLAAKQQELVEQQVLHAQNTSRAEEAVKTERESSEEWQTILARGKEMYGDAWNTPSEEGGGMPLSTLFAMHKDELLAHKEETEANLPPWERARLSEQIKNAGSGGGDNAARRRRKAERKQRKQQKKQEEQQQQQQQQQQFDQQQQFTDTRDRKMLSRFESPRQAPPALAGNAAMSFEERYMAANHSITYRAMPPSSAAVPPLSSRVTASGPIVDLHRAQMAGMDPELLQMSTLSAHPHRAGWERA